MEEKKATFIDKVKTFMVDHAEELILIGYAGISCLLLGASYKGIQLYNEKTRLEIENLKK